MHLIGDLELEAVKRVIEKQKLFRYQVDVESECQAFEREFAAHLGVKHALLVTSGTNALVAALVALGIGPGDEVIIPAYTFFATAQAVYLVGATPVVINIDKKLSIDLSEAEKKITSHTKAIMPVHMDGLPTDMEAILALANKYNLLVIEDTAQALGGSFKGKHLGTWGEIGCFSLNQDKNITAGEGGIVVTNSDELYEKLFCLQDGSGFFNPANKDFYKLTTPFVGMSMRVSEISGAIARVQLTRLQKILEGLRERKSIFVRELQKQTKAQVILGSCSEGDCSTSLHLLFKDPMEAQFKGRLLREKELHFLPPTMRPAHVAWKWAALLKNEKSLSQANFLGTTEILMSLLKMDISLKWTLEECDKKAKELLSFIVS